KGSSSGSGAQSDSGSPAADTGSSSACFHGEEYVLTEQYGRMKMSELVGKPSIKVQSRDDQGRMVFSPIYYWLHSEADTETNFI
uniref:Hedgehog protein Hint domain-containing protein n=1 Tax=Romanomermis culicivorax TaxID=13658 RepID=A0A915KGA1_ROMCU